MAARACGITGDLGRAAERAEQLLPAARSAGVLDVESDALTTLAVVRGTQGRPGESASLLAEALAVARRSGSLSAELRVAYNLGTTAYEDGDVLTAAAVVDDAVTRAEENGLGWSDYGLELRVLQVIVRYTAGDFEGSRRLAELAGQRPSEVVLARVGAAALPAVVARGDHDAADAVARLEGAWHHDGQVAMVAGGAAAELAIWGGDPDRALTVVGRAVDHVSRVWDPWFLGGIWLAAVGLAAAGDLAERARLGG